MHKEYIYAYIHICIYLYIHVSNIYISIYIYLYINTHLYRSIYVYVYIYIYKAVYVFIHIYIIIYIYIYKCIYEVRQFNSQNSCSVSLGCWVRQTRVLKHVWTCFNLRLHEPQTKWVVRSRAAEEIVRVRGIRLAEKWVTRIWSNG